MSDADVISVLTSPARNGGQRPTTVASLFAQTVIMPNGCVLWTGGKRHGYGRVSIGGKARRIHRIFYEFFEGPVPEGTDLDHTCHSNDASCAGGPSCIHRSCVNVAHLEPVDPWVNIYRGRSASAENVMKQFCVNGHEFTPENTRIIKPSKSAPRGARGCRRCAVKATQAWQERNGGSAELTREYRRRKREGAVV